MLTEIVTMMLQYLVTLIVHNLCANCSQYDICLTKQLST